MRTKTLGLSVLLLMALAALGMAGCSSRPTAGTSVDTRSVGTGALPAPAAGEVDVLLIDNSNPNVVNQLHREIAAIVVDSAVRHRTLAVAAMDAGPLRTSSWRIEPFGEYFARARPRRTAETKIAALANGMVPGISALGGAAQKEGGSGQIGGLRVAGELGHIGRVFEVTDGVPNSVDVPDVHTAGDAEIDHAAIRLGRGISGLKGVPVVFVGVGKDVQTDEAISRAKRLLLGVVAAAGGEGVWMPTIV